MREGLILIEKLIAYAQAFLYLDETDVTYMRNRLRQILKIEGGMTEKVDVSYVSKMETPDALLRELAEYLQLHSVCPEEDIERFSAMIMGELSPRPSAVVHAFRTTKERVGAEAACEYLYHLSMKNDYIKKSAVDKNLKWDYADQETGNRLEITVNLSKPEKNNKDIAKLLAMPKTDDLPYPPCVLCKENEGFYGNAKIAPRTNLRTLPLTLAGELWFMQYSPYLYYNEHCIVINNEHVPMAINKKTIQRVLDFVSYLPEYFLGSNAALPIV
ncbi:MAG: galactose-1-phosphate uridylyltransferase, partial [Clostridia bacterium]|nr:galactose-1-phosphate uridylyltransferase [Clostridia bacterium]